MSDQVTEQWAIVIDTDSYSGNFEREMGAFVTGQETVRGERFMDEIRKHFGFNSKLRGAYWEDDPRNPFANLFMQWPGEHGDELAHIEPTPGFGNDGKGNHARVDSPAKKKKYKWPAYQSVIMRCFERPSKEQIKILKEWAFKFSERSKAPKGAWVEAREERDPFHFKPAINILGIRLICEKTTTETVEEVDLALE